MWWPTISQILLNQDFATPQACTRMRPCASRVACIALMIGMVSICRGKYVPLSTTGYCDVPSDMVPTPNCKPEASTGYKIVFVSFHQRNGISPFNIWHHRPSFSSQKAVADC